MANTPLVNHNPFRSTVTRVNLRYCVQIRDRNRVIRCVIVRLEMPRFTTSNRIKELLNRKILDYITLEFPGQTLISAVINGRVDAEF